MQQAKLNFYRYFCSHLAMVLLSILNVSSSKTFCYRCQKYGNIRAQYSPFSQLLGSPSWLLACVGNHPREALQSGQRLSGTYCAHYPYSIHMHQVLGSFANESKVLLLHAPRRIGMSSLHTPASSSEDASMRTLASSSISALALTGVLM